VVLIGNFPVIPLVKRKRGRELRDLLCTSLWEYSEIFYIVIKVINIELLGTFAGRKCDICVSKLRRPE